VTRELELITVAGVCAWPLRPTKCQTRPGSDAEYNQRAFEFE
jgi:hypothetical protein